MARRARRREAAAAEAAEEREREQARRQRARATRERKRQREELESEKRLKKVRELAEIVLERAAGGGDGGPRRSARLEERATEDELREAAGYDERARERRGKGLRRDGEGRSPGGESTR